MTPEEAAALPIDTPVTVTVNGRVVSHWQEATRVRIKVCGGTTVLDVKPEWIERRAVPLAVGDEIRADSPEPPPGSVILNATGLSWQLRAAGVWWQSPHFSDVQWSNASGFVGGKVLHIPEETP